jgi:hypothetical protein
MLAEPCSASHLPGPITVSEQHKVPDDMLRLLPSPGAQQSHPSLPQHVRLHIPCDLHHMVPPLLPSAINCCDDENRQGWCRMDLPGPTTSVGTRTDYSVGPWDYPACATWHLKAWSTRTTQE